MCLYCQKTCEVTQNLGIRPLYTNQKRFAKTRILLVDVLRKACFKTKFDVFSYFEKTCEVKQRLAIWPLFTNQKRVVRTRILRAGVLP